MTKNILSFLTFLVCFSLARAGEVTVSAHMATGSDEDAATVTSFTADAEKLYAVFKAKGTQDGDKIRGVLIAEDVGSAAPANTKVLEETLDVKGDSNVRNYVGDFNFSKPTKGWPAGKYRVEVYLNDELATTVKFTIKAAKKKSTDEEEEESGD